jgi:hypothetical protein
MVLPALIDSQGAAMLPMYLDNQGVQGVMT